MVRIYKPQPGDSHRLSSSGGTAKKQQKQSDVPRRKISVDIVSGKNLVHVYFNPFVSLDCQNRDEDWLGNNLYVPASVIKEADECLTVRLPSGEVFKLPEAQAVRVNDQDDLGVEDILSLHEFSEMSFIHTLRVRYARDEIYSFVGSILISINPYKWHSQLYSEETMLSYHKIVKVIFSGGENSGSNVHTSQNPPHLFEVAESAYNALMGSITPDSVQAAAKLKNQSIIISGESGAGKYCC